MTQKRKKNNWTNKFFWALLVVLFVVAGVVAYFVVKEFMPRPEQEAQPETTTSEIMQGSTEEGPEEAPSETEEPDEPEDKKVPQYEGADPNEAAELTGVITFAAVQGDMLTIRTEIDQYLNGGACSLTLQRDGVTIYNSATTIQPNASNSTCLGFDVPTSGLGSGVVQIVIDLSAGGKTGVIQGEVKL